MTNATETTKEKSVISWQLLGLCIAGMCGTAVGYVLCLLINHS